MEILQNIRVLDLGRFISASYGAMLLADSGAEVIKVERAVRGEDGHAVPPYKDGINLYFPTFNRNKLGITIDFRNEESRAILTRLIEKSDVLIENFRPGTMKNMGFSWEQVHEINPRLVMASISGYGQDGPLAERPAFDPIAQALSGIMSVTGTKESGPLGVGTTFVDHVAGTTLAYGILLALIDRERTGQGQYIDVSLVDCVVPFLQTYIPNYSANGIVAPLHGNRDLLSCPADTYRTRDGRLVDMHAGTNALYVRLTALIDDDRMRDEKFQTVAGRNANQDEIESIVQEWFLTQDADEAVEKLARESVIAAAVADIPDLFSSDLAKRRRQLVDIEVPGLGPVTFPGSAVDILPGQPVDYHRAPTLGEHNDKIYTELLGYSADDVEGLRDRGVI